MTAITLDLDDTLWPARPTLRLAEQALSDWLAEHAPVTHAWLTPAARQALRAQVLADHAQRRHDVSFVRLEFLRRALKAAGEDDALAEKAFEIFLRARQKVEPYDDVEPVLARWSRRYRLVAVSNGNADIDLIGLGRYFTACVSAHQLDFGKPDPRIYLEACRRVGVEPAAALHVGDDFDLDVRAARSAGLRAAWLQRPDLVAAEEGSAARAVEAAHAARTPAPRPADSPQPAGDEAQACEPAVFESLQALDEFLHAAGPHERRHHRPA